MDILITANSPGEIAGLLRPVARILKEKVPSASVKVALLPCVFASGREAAVAAAMEWVDEVYPPARFLSLLNGPKPEKKTILLHLGGDLIYAAQMARKWEVPAWAYIWAGKRGDRYFKGYFVRHEMDVSRLIKQGINPGKIFRVGDLVVDSVHGSLSERRDPDPGEGCMRICFLPGSRLREIRALAPFFLEVAAGIRKAIPGCEFNLLLSPFLDRKETFSALRAGPDRKMGGLQGEVLEEDGVMRSPGGTVLRLVGESQYDFLSRADLAIAIPGTKTGEAGCLGVPLITIVPLNRIEEVPFFGILGLLDLVPWAGKHIKGMILEHFVKSRYGFVSQPNILAGREIVPEMVRHMTAGDVAVKALELLQDENGRRRISGELQELYSPHRGAAERLVERMLASE